MEKLSKQPSPDESGNLVNALVEDFIHKAFVDLPDFTDPEVTPDLGKRHRLATWCVTDFDRRQVDLDNEGVVQLVRGIKGVFDAGRVKDGSEDTNYGKSMDSELFRQCASHFVGAVIRISSANEFTLDESDTITDNMHGDLFIDPSVMGLPEDKKLNIRPFEEEPCVNLLTGEAPTNVPPAEGCPILYIDFVEKQTQVGADLWWPTALQVMRGDWDKVFQLQDLGRRIAREQRRIREGLGPRPSSRNRWTSDVQFKQNMWDEGREEKRAARVYPLSRQMYPPIYDIQRMTYPTGLPIEIQRGHVLIYDQTEKLTAVYNKKPE